MSNPVLPPVVGTNSLGIHSAAGGPAATDFGIAATFLGGVITDLQTTFRNTHDEYKDLYMQTQVDAIYDLNLDLDFNFDVHDRTKTATGATDPGVPTMQVGSLIDGDTVQILAVGDTRGFGPGTGTAPGTLWANGTKFIVMEAPGSLERQKLRKDKVKLAFRRYAAA